MGSYIECGFPKPIPKVNSRSISYLSICGGGSWKSGGLFNQQNEGKNEKKHGEVWIARKANGGKDITYIGFSKVDLHHCLHVSVHVKVW